RNPLRLMGVGGLVPCFQAHSNDVTFRSRRSCLGRGTMRDWYRSPYEQYTETKAEAAEYEMIPTPGKRTRTEMIERRSGGAALPGALSSSLSSALGADVGRVRVHTDNDAGDAAESFGARAFTYGQDIFFGPGMFQPDTSGGRELIAHEVAH